MVTNRRKRRSRNQLILRSAILFALILIGFVAALVTSFVLFGKHVYISPLAKIMPNDSLEKEDNDMHSIRYSLQSQKIEVSSIKHEDTRYEIVLKDNSRIILSSEKDIPSQISSLQFILSRLTMEGKLFTQLDLRFDKPVITLRK